MKMFWSAYFQRFSSLRRAGACRFWQHGQDRDDKRVSGGQRCHQVAHLVGIVLFQVALGDRQHDGHAAGNAQKHGGFAAEGVVVEQKVAPHAYVDQSVVQ